MPVEIIAVVAERFAQPVAIIKHGGDAVETETVEMVFVEPELAVGQQEVEHLILAVVKTQAVPSRMLATVALIEILAGVAGKVAQALHFVLHGMRMHDVHDDGQSQLMCLVDELLQLLRRAETAGRGEEARHMIAETAIIGMLLYGHNLDAVITVGGNARQHILTELVVRAYLFGILCHADVAFIYQQGRGVRTESLLLPHVRLLRCPNLRAENLRLVVLHHPAAPRGNAFAASSVPMHLQFIQVAMLERTGAELDFPVSRALDTLQLILGRLFPVVEIAYQVNLRCVGRPFAEHPARGRAVQSKIQISSGEVRQSGFSALRQLADFVQGVLMPSGDGRFEVFQPRVVFHDA